MASEKNMTPRDVLKLCADKGVKCVDIRFNDLIGTWQHLTVPISQLKEESFESGIAFDGSSFRAWRSIHESDMLAVPDPRTAFIDPFMKESTLVLICNIVDPITHQDYGRDPRNIARKAEAYMRSTGIADTAYFGPEAEFFVFDDVRFDSGPNFAFYELDSSEAVWNTGRDEKPNLGYKPRHKEGYFPVPPMDQLQDLRTEMCMNLEACGLSVERHHHEVATAGQCEINYRFGELVRAGDQMMVFKYIVKNTARKHNKTVTFMPKPLFGDNGSGMHVHFSIWKKGQNLMAGEKAYAGLSETALHVIGGLLKHAPALVAISNPTTNSYKRLVPGFEAPVNLAYSARNRSACCRIPVGDSRPEAKRVEFRCPDPSSNPYLTFSAMLMAALDGVQNRIDPGQALDKDIYDLPPEEKAHVPNTPGSLEAALENLEKDHEWLLKGDVFTEDLIATWIDYKRKKEVDHIRLRPTPQEFALYFDV
jgi:glutamine synthetase